MRERAFVFMFRLLFMFVFVIVSMLLSVIMCFRRWCVVVGGFACACLSCCACAHIEILAFRLGTPFASASCFGRVVGQLLRPVGRPVGRLVRMADDRSGAAQKRKFEDSGGHDYNVGQEVQYYCKHAKVWKDTTVAQIVRNGIKVTCRSTCIPSRDINHRLRPPIVSGRSATSRHEVKKDGGAEVVGSGVFRARGSYDPTFNDVGAKWLDACGSVAGVFRKFKDSFSSTGDRCKLKDAIEKTFPNLVEVSYKEFRGHPGECDANGYVHPCCA